MSKRMKYICMAVQDKSQSEHHDQAMVWRILQIRSTRSHSAQRQGQMLQHLIINSIRQWYTYVLLACTLVGYLGADNADKDTYLIAALVDLVGCPVDPLQRSLGDYI